MPLEIGTQLGPYEIAAPFGAGGMADVYRARDTRLERTVAVEGSLMAQPFDVETLKPNSEPILAVSQVGLAGSSVAASVSDTGVLVRPWRQAEGDLHKWHGAAGLGVPLGIAG